MNFNLYINYIDVLYCFTPKFNCMNRLTLLGHTLSYIFFLFVMAVLLKPVLKAWLDKV